MPGNPVKVGVIGCGTISQFVHLPNICASGAELVGVCDVDPTRLSMAQRRFGAPVAVREAEALMDQPGLEAVLIATHDVSHCDLAVAAVERGKHVFVEKPVCMSPAQGARLEEAVRRAGVVVGVGYQKLYDRGAAWLSRILAQGEDVFLVSARNICHDNDLVLAEVLPPEMQTSEFLRGRTDYGESPHWDGIVERYLPGCPRSLANTYRVFLNLACHDLSSVIGLLGSPTAIRYSEFWDHDSGPRCVVVYELGDGCRCVLEMALTSRKWFDQSLCLYGCDRTMTIRWPSPFRPGDLTVASCQQMTEAAPVTRQFSCEAFAAYRDEWDAFVTAVCGGNAHLGSLDLALSVLEWQFAAIVRDFRHRQDVVPVVT
ncbi:MAG TPA: Gfo/Idh/MocA family oxidoreductase [Acidimicrobiales bacterium]|nr:Gfo/Idh/MocA family oxidoreductase [Acidimicrobiales bacterium]